MGRVQLTMAFSRSAKTRPLLDGEVEIAGVDLNPCTISPGDLFWRQLHFQEFDLSELSLAGLAMQKSQGTSAYSATPAFPSRAFFHTNILVRDDSGLHDPGQLAGRAVGVAEYQQTAAVWARGALQHEFGVRPADIRWFMGRSPRRSHGSSTGFAPPPGIELHYIPDGSSLANLLLDGEIDAIIAYASRNGGLGLGQEDDLHPGTRPDSFVDPDTVDLTTRPEVRQLLADPIAEGRRYLERTGVFPINHVVAIRDELTEKYPWLARNVYDAFVRSRAIALTRLRRQLEPYEALGVLDVEAVLRSERWLPYGVAANRPTLDTAVRYMTEQGLIDGSITTGSLFAPTVAAV